MTSTEAWTASHAIAELFAVLTTLPARPRPSPAAVRALIDAHLAKRLTVRALVTSDVSLAMRRLGDLGIGGGRMYDALHVRAALRCKADVLLTLNQRHLFGIDAEADAILRVPSAEAP